MEETFIFNSLLGVISVLLTILSFFLVKWINAVDSLKTIIQELSLEMQKQKTSCPLLHGEIDRRFEKIEKRLDQI